MNAARLGGAVMRRRDAGVGPAWDGVAPPHQVELVGFQGKRVKPA